MPPKRKVKIDKKIERNTEKKPPKTTVKATKASAGRVDKGKLPATVKAKPAFKNGTGTKLVSASQKFQKDIEGFNLEDNRKRSSDEEESIRPPSAAKKLRLTEEDPLKKAIDEIEMEGTSSEIEYSEYYRQSARESAIADAEKLLESRSVSDVASSVSSEDNDPEYVKQYELEEAPDFFVNFGDVPDVDEVSLDISVDMVKEKPLVAEQKGPLDIGKFVNPLTGESASSPESSKEQLEVEEIEVVEVTVESGAEEEDEKLSVQDSVDIPIMSDQEMENEVITHKMVDEEDAFNQFLELEAQGPNDVVEAIDVEALALEENARLLWLYTNEFVQDLIDRAVELAEYVDPKVVLRQNLDKRKLVKELQQKLTVLEIERRGKQFLNRKCVEYFRRKRCFRPILDDNPKTVNQEIRKYQSAVNSLDHWLCKEEEAKALTQENLTILREEVELAKERSLDKISNLEKMIRKTLQGENFDKLQYVVENSLVKMNAVRQEISRVRFQLILKQHSVATLVEQLSDLEDLGNGLSMRHFESIQTETQAWSKKIEERNSELNKLRYRCHGDIHRMAHQKEKQKMLRDTITFQRHYLEELQIEKQRLREVLFKRKIDRSHIRKDIRDISFQSGLLDKPVLMKDYDKTVEYLEELRERVNRSKATVNQLNEKIGMLENHSEVRNKSISLVSGAA